MANNKYQRIPSQACSFLHKAIGSIYAQENKKNSEYWHYTSSKGVLGIFDSYIKSNYKEDFVKKANVFASNIRFLNDSQEYQKGNEEFNDLCKKFSFSVPSSSFKIDDNMYLISFCGNCDLLSQWKWYGKESGVALCFELPSTKYKTFEYYDANGNIRNDLSFYDYDTKPLKVRYKEEEQIDLFNLLINDKDIKQSSAQYLIKSLFVPLCKNKSFEEEKESRLVFYDSETSHNNKLFQKYNIVYNANSSSVIKPALNVEFSLNKKSKHKNVISKIMVGPGYNQELMFNFLIHIFDSKYYSYQETIIDDKTPLDIKQLASNRHHNHLIICKDGQIREAYMCDNGIVIMKSAIPFRG